ncbi:MAG: HNH endonuclease [Taibaiella sp.]|nr:HNH endonuclease [Taibaiella sp.]
MAGKRWSDEEQRLLREFYPYEATEVTAARVGREVGPTYQQANKMGLKKIAEHIAVMQQKTIKNLQEGGRCHRYEKGNVPVNKGRSMAEWMGEDAMERVRKTQFKSGQLPHNTRGDGDVSIRADKCGRKYKFVRIGLAEWRPLHRVEWEKRYGKIPDGLILVCKGTDTLDVNPDNWELINRVENMARNTVHNYPPEVQKSVQLMGVLRRQINKRTKNGTDDN